MIRDLRGQAALERLAQLQQFHAAAGAATGQIHPSAAVWSRYHPVWTPWLVEVLDDGETVAAMGLAVRRRTGVLHARGLGADDEEAIVAAMGPAAAGALGRAVRSALADEDHLWSLRLGLLVADHRSAAFVRALPRSEIHPVGGLPQAVFMPGEPLGTHVSRKMRDGANRARNLAVRAETPLVPRWLADPAEIEQVLPEVIEVHRARNRQAHGYAILDDPGEASQFQDTVLANAHSGAAYLLEVRAAGELAAFSVCFTNGRLMRVYANLVSPRWLHVNAGTFASVEIVRRAHLDPTIGALSWGAGVNRYKLSCATGTGELQSVQGYSSRAAQLLAQASRSLGLRETGGDRTTCVDPVPTAQSSTQTVSPPTTGHLGPRMGAR